MTFEFILSDFNIIYNSKLGASPTKYLDDCVDEGAAVLALPAAGVCAHLGITAAVRARLWFDAIDLLVDHPPHAVRPMMSFAAIDLH